MKYHTTYLKIVPDCEFILENNSIKMLKMNLLSDQLLFLSHTLIDIDYKL